MLCIYIGSWFGIQINLKNKNKKDNEEAEEQETMTVKDAAMFPIYGSLVLLSLYCVFKVIDKKILTYSFSAYFTVAGVYCTMQLFEYYLLDYFPGYEKTVLINQKYDINLILYKTNIHFHFTKMDIITLILASPIALYYGFTRYWLLNNFFGVLFSVIGI